MSCSINGSCWNLWSSVTWAQLPNTEIQNLIHPLHVTPLIQRKTILQCIKIQGFQRSYNIPTSKYVYLYQSYLATLTPNAITLLTISKVMHQASNIKTTTTVYFQCEDWRRKLQTPNGVTSDRAWPHFHWYTSPVCNIIYLVCYKREHVPYLTNGMVHLNMTSNSCIITAGMKQCICKSYIFSFSRKCMFYITRMWGDIRSSHNDK
jgi:hypothetical protein